MRAIFLLFLFGAAFAAPAPMQTIINNATKECGSYSAGDECTRCEMPEGWAGIGIGAVPCPEGFVEANPQAECSALKNEFCCSEGHSGSDGDCGKLMINHVRKECVFSDAANCSLSADWAQSRGLCPEGYAWPETACRSDRTCLPGLGFGALLAFIFIKSKPSGGGDERCP